MNGDPVVIAESDFTSDTEGWMVQVGYPNAVANVVPGWNQSESGFSTGTIEYSSSMSSVQGRIYFSAPQAFLGDLASAYDQNLNWQMRFTLPGGMETSEFYTGNKALIIVGATDSLWFEVPAEDTWNSDHQNAVQNITLRLVETTPCFLMSTFARPTQSQFQAILANVTAILIRADYYSDADVWSTSVGAVQLYGQGLDPLLDQLQQNLSGTSDPVLLDSTTMGAAGASVVALFQAQLGQDDIAFARTGFSVTPNNANNTLTISGEVNDSLFGISQPTATAVFGVDEEQYTMILEVTCPSGWTLSQSFPLFAETYLAGLSFSLGADEAPVFYLTNVVGDVPGAGSALVSGLNLGGELNLTGPASSVLVKIPGASNPLPVMGQAQTLQDDNLFSLNGTLPGLSLAVPGLIQLDFNPNALNVFGRIFSDGDFTAYYQSLSFLSNVSVDGVAMPLALQLPGPANGWVISLQDGEAVRVADIASFLGFMVGLDLQSMLPQAVKSMNSFVVTDLTLQLKDGFDGIKVYSIEVISDTTGVEGGSSLWSILPGVLELTGVAFTLEGFNNPNGMVMGGSIQGDFELVSTLNLSMLLPLPLGTGAWRFTASSEKPVGLSDFARLFNSTPLANYMPGNLGSRSGFVLDELTVAYDPSSNTLSETALTLSLASPWPVISGQLTLQSFYLNLLMANPLDDSRTMSGTIGCDLVLGSVLVSSVITKETGGDWLLSIDSDEIALPSLSELSGISATDVPSLVPASILSCHFTLFDLSIEANLSEPRISRLGFTLSTDDPWTLIENLLVVTQIGLQLSLDWTSGQLVTTGSILAGVDFAGGDFLLSATKNPNDWSLSATLVKDSQLSLMNLADTMVTGSSATLRQIGVPDIVLTAGQITYNTGTEAYSLSAQVDLQGANNQPWMIGIGVASLSILGLGIDINSVVTAGQRNTTTSVTGSLAVGSTINFDVAYEIGGDLIITGTLIDEQTQVSVFQLVNQLCSGGSSDVTWTTAFESLDQLTLSGVSLAINLAESNSSFQLQGTLNLGEGNSVSALFIVEQVNSQWEFALAAKLDATWTLTGFTDAFSAFNIDTGNWAVVASSFTKSTYSLPATFQLANVQTIERGLNFYGEIHVNQTIDTMQYAISSLPQGTMPSTTIIVDGLLVEPIANSYLEVIISASDEGLPLLGWEQVLLSKLALRLYGTPSLAFHAEFKLLMLTDGSGNPFKIIIEMELTSEYIEVKLLPPPGKPIEEVTPIFVWADALGIQGLSVYLTDLDLKLYYTGIFGGTIGGGVDFEGLTDPRLAVMKGRPPDPLLVELSTRALIRKDPTGLSDWEARGTYDLARAFDPDLIRVMMRVSFIIVGDEPVPTRLAGEFINFTLPYIIHRFTSITIPDVLVPVQFPRIAFDVSFNPEQPANLLNFSFDGEIVIYGFHGQVRASFSETQGIYFFASMDPIHFSIGTTNIVSIQRSPDDTSLGPYVLVNSNASGTTQDPNLSAQIYCNFFGELSFNGQALVLFNQSNPASSTFYFLIQGAVGSIAAIQLTCTYVEALHLSASGSFQFALGSFTVPGFSNNGTKIADQINIKSEWGLLLYASLGIDLNARPPNPSFSGTLQGGFAINLAGCHAQCDLSFHVTITEDLFSSLPTQIVNQIQNNAASVFGGLLQSAECFAQFILNGLITLALEDAAKVFNAIFNTGINLGSTLLADLGSNADDLVDWLKDIFGSDDTEANTKALQQTGHYTPEEIGEAVKHSNPQYTPAQLVSDQMAAGVSPINIAAALKATFGCTITVTGQLLVTAGVGMATIAAAFRSAYASDVATAEEIYAALTGSYSQTQISAQDMANTLAPYYTAASVAGVLQSHYPDNASTAPQLLGLLYPAYLAAGLTLDVNAMASVLAPLFPAGDTALALQGQYAAETATPALMAAIIQNAYTIIGSPLDAPGMTSMLAGCQYAANQVAVVLNTYFGASLQTASAMAALLYNAYGSQQLQATAMAEALAAISYPATQVASALMLYYASSINDVQAMIGLLKPYYNPAQTAPALYATFTSAVSTASDMANVLTTGFGTDLMTLPLMASALALTPFDPQQVAPVLLSTYSVPDALTMANTLLTAYGQGAITPMTMAKALAASPYPTTSTAAALQQLFSSSTATVQEMADLLAEAPYTAADVAPVLKDLYGSSVPHAQDMAATLSSYYSPATVAPVLKTLYSTDVPNSSAMITVLTNGYTPYVFTAQTMVSALAAAPYPPTDAAPALKAAYSIEDASDLAYILQAGYGAALTAQLMANSIAAASYDPTFAALVLKRLYLDESGTASQMASLLVAAYASDVLTASALVHALVATQFRAFEVAPPVESAFTVAVSDLSIMLVNEYANVSMLYPLALGVALISAGFSGSDIDTGIIAGFPNITPDAANTIGETVTVTGMMDYVTTVEGYRQAGETIGSAAQAFAQSQPNVPFPVLTAALASVYAGTTFVPNIFSAALATAITPPNATNIASALILLMPNWTAASLLNSLFYGFAAAQVSLTETAAAQALAAAMSSVGAALDQPAMAVALVSGYRNSTSPLNVANALCAAFNTAATTSSVTQALMAGYASASLPLYPGGNMLAVSLAFGIPTSSPATLVPVTGDAYLLGGASNYIGALAVACSETGFQFPAVCGALSSYYGALWLNGGLQTTLDAYNNSDWLLASNLQTQGYSVTDTATAMRTSDPNILPKDMVAILAATFNLVHTETSVRPIAQAMKAAGFTFVETTGAMKLQYAPDWTIEDLQIVLEIFSS